MPSPHRPRRSRAAGALALALAASLTGVSGARAQTGIDTLRTQMEASLARLSQIDGGLLRATMQAPDMREHAQNLQILIASVQLDLDYLEALLRMVQLARDPAEAGPVVLRELQGARDRMLLDVLEEDVRVRRETGGFTAPALQQVESALIAELRRVVGMYDRIDELLTPP